MKTKKNIRNELLKRQELIVEIEDEKNPGFEKTKKQIAEKFSKPEENIDIRKVQGSFGKKTFIIEANIYDSKKDLDDIKKLEITKKQRKEQAEAKKKSEEEKTKEQTQEQPEQKPTEAPVEEKPEQESKES